MLRSFLRCRCCKSDAQLAMEDLRERFFRAAKLDENSADGTVSRRELYQTLKMDKELEALVKRAGFNPKAEGRSMLDHIDTDGDGKVTWTEFKEFLQDAAVLSDEDLVIKQLKKIFQRAAGLDMCKDDTKMSQRELYKSLKEDQKLQALVKKAGFNLNADGVFEQLDKNGDNEVSWKEFEQSLRTAATDQVQGS